MADQIYYSVFTKKGLQLLTEAIQNGTKLGITSMAFGDGGGSLPVPNEAFTQLVNEVHRTQLNSLAPDPNNANWLRAEAIIASAVGGFNIRELGLYAGDVLVAYSNYPATYKPNPSDGTARIMTFRMILQIDNTANFDLVIDPDIVLATLAAVKESISLDQGGDIHDAIKFVTPQMFGAIGDGIVDDTIAFKKSIQYCCLNKIKELHIPSGKYVISDTLYLVETDDVGNPLRRDYGVTIVGAGRFNTFILFKAKSEEHVLFDTYGISAVDTNKNVQNMSIRPYSEDFLNPLSILKSPYVLKGIALNVRETCGCLYSGLDIKFMYVGIQLTCGNGDPISYTGNDNTDASRGWSEFNRFIYNNLWSNKIGVRFYGGGSYHGNNFETTKIQGLEEYQYRTLNLESGRCYGIQAIGAINTKRKNDAYWNTANIYNCYFDIGFFGNTDKNFPFVAIQVDNARTFCNTGGRITHEGNVYFEALNSGWWAFDGDINGYNLKYLTDSSNNTMYPYGNFAFKNWSSNLIGSEMASTSQVLLNKGATNVFRLGEEPDNDFDNVFPRAMNSNPFPDVLRLSGSNIESLAFTTYGFNTYNKFWFGNNARNTKPKDFVPTFSFSVDGSLTETYGSTKYTHNIVDPTDGSTVTSGYTLSSSYFRPYKTTSIDFGNTDYRWNNAYFKQWSFLENSLRPVLTASNSIGTSSLTIKDIYTQNAVTVVSDENHKTDISELNESEIACAKACAKLYRRYKLKAAIKEKSETDARYHFGAIAQEIVQCFTDHDLDWKQYGIITYEKWDSIAEVKYQAATYDENNQELTPEISAVEGREAGEIYMMRYEEFNCFVNAGMEAMLSELENRISKLENDSIS